MTYYVASARSARKVYHQRKDCSRIKSVAEEKPKRFVEWHDMDPCPYCDPNRTPPGSKHNYNREYIKALERNKNE